jgi:mannose-6-phosphate isomerase
MLKNSALYKLSPHYVPKIWGGQRLVKLRNYPQKWAEGKKFGESWEISIHPQGQSKVNNTSLSDLIGHNELPYLLKLIDTKDNLSIQVHPDNQYARRIEETCGKDECWLVLSAGEKSGVYLGLKEGVTREKFRGDIAKNENISKHMNFITVEPGDFFYVPAGTAHAIGEDILLVEIQQNSGITYRIWDWDRKISINGNKRDTHIDKAFDVLKFGLEHNSFDNFKIQTGSFSDWIDHKLIRHPDFNVDLLNWEKYSEKKFLLNAHRARGIFVLDGEVNLMRGQEKLTLKAFDTALVPVTGNNKLHISSISSCRFLMIH